jgi:hypothetical protein
MREMHSKEESMLHKGENNYIFDFIFIAKPPSIICRGKKKSSNISLI